MADLVSASPKVVLSLGADEMDFDAFAGALVAKLAEGATLIEASCFAARVGAFAATRPGAQASYPTLDSTLPTVND